LANCLFEVDKACKEVFTILPKFLKDILQNEDLVRGIEIRTKTALSILLLFTAFSFKRFGIWHVVFSWQTKR